VSTACCHLPTHSVVEPSTVIQWHRQAWGTGARAPPPLEFGARTKFSLYFGQENRIFLATTGVLWPKICRKCDSGRSSRRSPRPRSRLGSGHPSPYPPHLAPFGASMLAPSAPRSSCPLPDTKSWRRHCGDQHVCLSVSWLACLADRPAPHSVLQDS